MSSKSWKLIKRTFLYKAKTDDEISFVSDNILLPSGRHIDYIFVDSPYSVVCVLGFEKGKVLLINQHRYLINDYLLEIPAGSPVNNETLEEGAGREFLEETGYKAKKLIKLGEFFPSIGITNQLFHLYLALDLEKQAQELEETEDIKTMWLGFEDALAKVTRNEIKHAAAAYSILLLEKWLEKNKTLQYE